MNVLVVSEPALMRTSIPEYDSYAWSTTLPVTTTVSPEYTATFSTLATTMNSQSSAWDVGINENIIKNANNPVTMILLLYTCGDFDFCS